MKNRLVKLLLGSLLVALSIAYSYDSIIHQNGSDATTGGLWDYFSIYPFLGDVRVYWYGTGSGDSAISLYLILIFLSGLALIFDKYSEGALLMFSITTFLVFAIGIVVKLIYYSDDFNHNEMKGNVILVVLSVSSFYLLYTTKSNLRIQNK